MTTTTLAKRTPDFVALILSGDFSRSTTELRRQPQQHRAQETKCAEIGEIQKDEAVTAQLRTMQRQLQQLVQLPATIQATLAAVSSKIQTLLPQESEPDAEVLTDTDITESEDEVQSEDSGEILEEDITESIEIITEESSDMEALQHPASQSDSEPPASPEPRTPTPPPPTEEDLQKLAKVQKLQSLNKSWPWADDAKPVYKISEHYEPVYARCIDNKVKWLEQKISEDKVLARRIKGM